jgi:hypothetical protein
MCSPTMGFLKECGCLLNGFLNANPFTPVVSTYLLSPNRKIAFSKNRQEKTV